MTTTPKRARELADHLWDIARLRLLMSTRATEDSPTMADVTKDAANALLDLLLELDSLRAQLATHAEEGEVERLRNACKGLLDIVHDDLTHARQLDHAKAIATAHELIGR